MEYTTNPEPMLAGVPNRTSTQLGSWLLVVCVGFHCGHPVAAQETARQPEVCREVGHDASPALRDIRPIRPLPEQPREKPLRPIPSAPGIPNQADTVAQAGSSQKLDSLADRLMYSLAYRSFGTHESQVVRETAGSSGGKINYFSDPDCYFSSGDTNFPSSAPADCLQFCPVSNK